MRTRKWLWRWRNNPLKRRSDRVEAWVGLAAGVVMAASAPVTGAMASDALGDSLRENSQLTRTKAVLTENAPTTDSFATVTGDARVPAKVRWESADGHSRTARAPVEAGTPARTNVTVWLDSRGVPRQPPPGATEIMGESAAAGSAAAVATCFVIGGGCWLTRRRIDAARDKDWEREWAAVGPWWTRRE
ncbi:hypothetical protein ACFPA8_09420 [Streptomyces ovatisporus]|uniref:Membrane protein SCJ1.26 n=1 Tax=Streptomyces ovatisporus TaxID=1128682 RepID=A0ABV9A9T3_9ACTN